ncbi:family 78 glycoside hydrolase catalytic domain [Arthrobacter sp. Z4-13]
MPITTVTGPNVDFADAKWISPIEPEIPAAGHRPAYEFSRTFAIDSPSDGQLTITAHGIYEAFVNGERVGTEELAPGFTSYRSRLYVQDHDVSALLRPGDNRLTIVVSDGWWRGKCGAARVPDNFGKSVAVIVRLQMRDAKGKLSEMYTDGHWQYRIGPIVAADLMDGQTTDLRRTDVQEWHVVGICAEAADSTHDLERSPAPPVRRVREYPPVSISRLPFGRQIVDFGTNLNGWIRLSRLGPAGRTTVLTHGEALTQDGDLTTSHVEFELPGQGRLPLGQIDRVTSRGVSGDVFEPRHTTHGFRYVAVDGCDEDLQPDDITAVMVRSDLTPTGTFWCDSADITRLHAITVQSWQSNSCDIPTDCPQRERLGYTGDFQIFIDAAAYVDDISGFARKWLRSLADDQHPDGRITNVAPDCGPLPGFPAGAMDGSAGWGDAATIVPWALYQAYGDKTLLRDSLPMMRRWVDWAADRAATERHPSRSAKRAVAAPHERYLWDTGFHWGEWSEPDEPEFDYTADQAIIATAYLARSSQLVSLAALELGQKDLAEHYRALHEQVRAAWQAEFVCGGELRTDRQANHVRALAFNLVPEELRSTIADRLVQLIRSAGDHLNTGFLATGMLLTTLAENGHLDVAYDLLTQRTEPSWFTMLDRGATTVWESWGGIDEYGRAHASQDHYSKGAVITFLHRYVAGILPHADAPGYRKFTLRIRPTAHVSAAAGSLQTRYGTIHSAWNVTDGTVHLTASVPPGTQAVIDLPGRAPFTVSAGDHRFSSALELDLAPR